MCSSFAVTMPELGVAEFPPKLVPDGSDFHSGRGFWSVLNRVNHPRRSQEQHHNDQDRNDGPGQFDLCTTVYLRRLFVALAGVAWNLANEYTSKVKTTTNMIPVMESTNMDRSKMDLAGVDSGAKMFSRPVEGAAVSAANAADTERISSTMI